MMYRILNKQGVSAQNLYFASLHESTKLSIKKCSFCHFCHHRALKKNDLLRVKYSSMSTGISELLFPKEWKRKKKFVELLKVKNDVDLIKAAAVQKLQLSRMSMLVDKSDTTHNQVHKIDTHDSNKSKKSQDEEKILDNQEDIRDVESKNTNDRTKSMNMMQATKDSSIELPMNTKSEAKVKSNTCKTISTEKVKQSMPKQSDEDYLFKLLSYVQMYIDIGKLKKAESLLMHYRKREGTYRNLYKKDSLLKSFQYYYNIVIDAYAARGNLTKVLELYNYMKTDSKKPTLQTYSYILECIGRASNNSENEAILKKIHSDMEAENISFNDIFNKAVLKNNQHKMILKSIRKLDPNFKPKLQSPSLDYNCSLLNDIICEDTPKSVINFLNQTELHKALRDQICAERRGVVKMLNIVNNVPQTSQEDCKQKIESLEKSWEENATKAFEQNLFYLKQQESSPVQKSMILYPFLQVLPKEIYIHAVMREARELAENGGTFGTSLISSYASLGQLIFKKYELQKAIKDGLLDKLIDTYVKYLDWYLNGKSGTNYRLEWLKCIHALNNNEKSLTYHLTPWPKSVCVRIGQFLYNIIFNEMKIEIDNPKKNDKKCYPAFYTTIKTVDKTLIEQARSHPAVVKLYKSSFQVLPNIYFETHLLPSLIPPRPWTNINSGGYFLTKSNFMRIAPSFQDKSYKVLNQEPQENLNPIFDTINQQSSVPWRINTALLDVLIEVFKKGGNADLKIPESPNTYPPFKQTLVDDGTLLTKKKIYFEKLNHLNKQKDSYSLWCDTLYKLTIANHFRDKIFWLPQNIDFRGRVYSIPPHLSHLGNDLARSLLLFAEGKKLGVDGLDWLKIHLVNLLGSLKKKPIQERLKYANDNMDLIRDSAENPLTGKMWWVNSDDPWQTLAVCKEIVTAMESPNPAEFISHLPIHQDGSCNGLQHYAALGRDKVGAISVNLACSELPQDVYSTVVSLVEKQRQIDADNGNMLAKQLEGFITRKVIKQTVMTTVYGVTQYGATIQILKRLKEINELSDDIVFKASRYLVKITFQSLRTMFTSAKKIQDWFNNCATVITGDCNQEIQWITPLGLPVIQPYIKFSPFLFKVVDKNGIPKLDSIKQKNGFAPNFIHSLDSSHMMLTSIYSLQEGITFISVHDCYWTHPSTVDIMNRICRDQFIALHSTPILENLSQFFIKTYADSLQDERVKANLIRIFKKIPEKGIFDLNEVRSSVYFFS